MPPPTIPSTFNGHLTSAPTHRLLRAACWLGQASKLIQQTAGREFLRTKHGARSPLRQSGQQSPSSRAGPAKPRCSAANHKGVRGDLRIMDRSIPSHQIGSHQNTGCVPGRVFLADLCCAPSSPVSPQDADGDLHDMNLKLLVLARKREVARPEGAAPKKAPRTRWLDRGAAARSGWGARIKRAGRS